MGLGEATHATVLVADDDPDLVALVARRLIRAGYQVLTASDGEQALQMAKESLPQLLVLDVMMPKLTGIEVMEKIRSHPATRHIPVILISAGLQNDILARGISATADDYIKKPFGPGELPNRVKAVLAR